ncbi:hypothetical protein ACQ5T0_07255, partial [Vibrio cholerae]
SQISMRSCLGTSNISHIAPWVHGAYTHEFLFGYVPHSTTVNGIVANWNVLSTVRLGMKVLWHSGYTTTRENLLAAVTMLGQSIFKHSWALGKL